MAGFEGLAQGLQRAWGELGGLVHEQHATVRTGDRSRFAQSGTASHQGGHVVDQDGAKRALQTAAAGGHHVLMMGPPGTGKTMLASRFPGIMAPLTEDEQFEVASIRSAARCRQG